MVRKAHIKDGVVVNISVATELQPGDIDGTNAAVGDLWDGATFTRPAPVVIVPTEVTMRQARLALLEANMLDAVNTAISSAPQAAQIEWEYASTVERDSSLVQSMAAALNLSDAQLDALFISAGGK